MVSRLLAAAVLAASMILIPHASAQKIDDSLTYFKDPSVVKLDLIIAAKDLEALANEPRKYVHADLKEGDKAVWKDVGVHLKGGEKTFRKIDDKPGFTINIDKFSNEVMFHGLDKLHLANSIEDKTYIRELLAGEVFRAAGVYAARCRPALVSINGKIRGLYYIKEGHDNAYLKKHFKSKIGNFYEGEGKKDIDQDLELISGKEDVAPHEDLRKLVAASKEDAKVRYAKMEKLLDMDPFISFLAASTFTNFKSYGHSLNNYRVYHDPKRDKLIFLPGSMDEAFHEKDLPFLPKYEGMIARAVMETPQGKDKYLKRVESLTFTAFKAETLSKRIDDLAAKITPVLNTINSKEAAEYPERIKKLKALVVRRSNAMVEEVRKAKGK
jgi:spore coat protein H